MTLYIVRGIPGTGKSTYAKKLGCFHVEADMFHIKDGEYKFDIQRTRLGHNWCQKIALLAMEQGIDVAVSNTFTQNWEIAPYLEFAKKTGHSVEVIRMASEFGSVHGVPEDIMKKMRERFEDVDGEVVVGIA